MFVFVCTLVVGLARASTSEIDPDLNIDGQPNTCGRDYCAYQNDLDEAECTVQLATSGAIDGYYNCAMVFIEGSCHTDLGTGCRHQSYPSDCWIECEDYGVSIDVWPNLTGPALSQWIRETYPSLSVLCVMRCYPLPEDHCEPYYDGTGLGENMYEACFNAEGLALDDLNRAGCDVDFCERIR